MSVPDWPNSYGYNMFLFPPRLWIGGILYEHTHRLMGTVVGFCALVLTLVAWGPARHQRGRSAIRMIAQFAVLVLMLALIPVVVGSRFDIPTPLVRRVSLQVGVACVGILMCAAVAWCCRIPEPRRWVRWITVAVLIVVLFQGLLGGLRVVLVNLGDAVVHACVAQAFFCLAAFAAVVTSRWWNQPHQVPPAEWRSGRRLYWLGVATVAIVYLQLIVGALMRHFQAGLAIPDLPLAYGKLLPPINQAQLDAVNWVRVRQWDLDAVTLGQVWLHFAHRIGAILVSIAVLALASLVLARYRMRPKLLRPAALLIALLAGQVTLGVLTVLLRKPADVASAHVAVGALVLVGSFVLTARAARLYGPLRPRETTVNSVAREPGILASV